MKIALVGYGKMGHMIAECAKNLGHEIVATVDVVSADATVKVSAGDYDSVARAVKSSGAEGIIEFSHPTAVMGNIKALLPLGLPIVVGTTGWNDKYDEVNKLAASCGGTIMTSSNFSIGVNMLYKIVAEAVKIMEQWPEYDIATWEAHHNQKADSPSGTALTIAETILANTKKKTEIVSTFLQHAAAQFLERTLYFLTARQTQSKSLTAHAAAKVLPLERFTRWKNFQTL